MIGLAETEKAAHPIMYSLPLLEQYYTSAQSQTYSH